MQLETAEVHVLVNAAGAQHMWLQWQDLGQPAYASVCSPPFTHRSWPTGTFYNDMRQQGAQDYSDPIRRYNRWARFVVLPPPLSCTKCRMGEPLRCIMGAQPAALLRFG